MTPVQLVAKNTHDDKALLKLAKIVRSRIKFGLQYLKWKCVSKSRIFNWSLPLYRDIPEDDW